MKKPLLAVRDIVRITGITTRTLHYYDRIGLFKPTYLAENGYRLYDRGSLEKLQTILFLKEMDFSLKEIAEILKLAKHEQKQLLKKHSLTLQTRKQRLETIMTALDEYVSGKDIYSLQIFDHSSILSLQEQYANEAKFVYGQTDGYIEFEGKLKNLSSGEEAELFFEFEQTMKGIFQKIASYIHQSPFSDEMQRLVVEWKNCLGQFMTCDSELLACIANTYKGDARFKSYINQYSNEDMAEFLYSAIMYHINQET